MKFTSLRSAMLTFCLINLSSVAHSADLTTDKQFRQFDQLIQGEFDNYNQFNFENNEFLEKIDRVEEKHSRMYMRITRVDAPQIGEHVYYQQMHRGDINTPIYRQVLFVVKANHKEKALVSQSYKFNKPKKYENLWNMATQPDLTLADLQGVGSNCDSKYRLMGDTFIAKMKWQDCVVKSKHGGEIQIASQTVISQDEYWHIEGGYNAKGEMRFGRKDGLPLKMRRAKRFQCWAALKTDQKKDDGEYEWDFFPELSLHNQGDTAYFFRSDAPEKQYFIRLKETVFPAGKRPDVLELFVHEANKEAEENYTKALSYTWTNTEATRLGINLRWFQASCSLPDTK